MAHKDIEKELNALLLVLGTFQPDTGAGKRHHHRMETTGTVVKFGFRRLNVTALNAPPHGSERDPHVEDQRLPMGNFLQ